MIKRLLFILFVLISSCCSCSKLDIDSHIKDFYTEIIQETSYRTSILFFTDPHINQDNAQFRYYLRNIKNYYKALPLEFCLSGGDWLNNNDTYSEAIEKLTFINDITQD